MEQKDEIKKDLKILSLGDTHGRNRWKVALFGSLEGYEKWRSVCDDPNADLSEFPISGYDKIIFIGDYVDSFLISAGEIKYNLSELVHLKLKFPEIVVLLLGNHDIAYKNGIYCSGFKAEMLHDYQDLFRTKLGRDSIFQVAYQHKNWLWTHAGITQGFYKDIIEPLKGKKGGRFADFYKKCENLAEILNFMYESGNEDIFRVGYSRGGFSKVPGPFWADKSDLYGKPMLGVNQVVGHTPQPCIKGYEFGSGRHEPSPISLYFIDNLEYGADQALVLDFSKEPVENSIVYLS
jgi:hypothetical protein